MKFNALSLALIVSLGLAVVPVGHAQTTQEFVPQHVQELTVAPGTRVILEAPAPQPAAGCKCCVGNFLCRAFSPRCWGHHDEIVTGNIHSELVFIFGSSRAYFGEPCRPIPPGVYGCGEGRYGIAPYAIHNCSTVGSPGFANSVGAINPNGGGAGGCANGNCGR